MCIICYKPAGKVDISPRILADCESVNTHGCGFMFPHKGQVHINKGFISVGAMLRCKRNLFKKFKLDVVNTPVVYHFRIATHGGICPANCHPFPLSADTKDLQALSIKADVGVAHNGVLPLIDKSEKDISDTQQLVKYGLSHMTFKDIRAAKSLIKLALREDRMIVMSGRREIETFGFWYEDEGSYFSNLSFRRAESKRAKKKEEKSKQTNLIPYARPQWPAVTQATKQNAHGAAGYGDFYEPCDLCNKVQSYTALSTVMKDSLLLSLCDECTNMVLQSDDTAELRFASSSFRSKFPSLTAAQERKSVDVYSYYGRHMYSW